MLRPEDVARRWGVNVKTVYAAIRRRQLPVKRLGERVLLIPRRAVEEIEQGRVALPGGNHGGATR
jgi:excisionase family DNA binding protein